MASPNTKNSEVVDLNDTAIGLVKAYQVLKRNIHWRVDLPTEPTLISLSDDQVERAIDNILNNAIHAVGAGGSIQVTLFSDAESIRLDIHDSGPGVSSLIADRLFQEGVTHKKEGGTGLGLANSQKALEALGGKISYERSKALGGACFKILIPRVRLNTTSTWIHLRERVFIVDDDPNSIFAIKERLKGGTHQLVSFSNFDSAAQEIAKQPNDTSFSLITDLVLDRQDVTGIDLIHLAAEKTHGYDNHCLFSSLGSNADLKALAQKIGFQIADKSDLPSLRFARR